MPFHTLLFFSVIKDDPQLNSITICRLQDTSQAYHVNTAGKSIFFRVQAGVAVDVLIAFYQQQY